MYPYIVALWKLSNLFTHCYQQTFVCKFVCLQEFVAQYREQFHTLATKGQEMDETYGKLLVIAIMLV